MLHEQCEDHRLAELEAEAGVFVVCAGLGINSDDYSFGYVATWAGAGDETITKITQLDSRIQHAAASTSFETEQRAEVA